MATSVKKYLKIYWKLIKFSMTLEMEYRAGFILEIFVEIAYFISTLFTMRVLFWNIKEVAGWNYYSLIVLMGLNMVFSEIVLGLFFIHNLRDLPNKIIKGDLDLLLSKPLNVQFAVSTWRPYFAMIPGVLVGMLTMLYGFEKGGYTFDFSIVLPFLILFISGILIAYSIGVIVTTLSFWILNAAPLPMLAQNVLFMAKNPYSVYTGVWKIVFLTLVPLAFMVSLPASTLLNSFTWWWPWLSVVIAALFLRASVVFWKFALRKYSSASS